MAILLINDAKIAEINAAVEEARAHVVPWEKLRDIVVDSPTDTLMLSERKEGTEGSAGRPESIAVEFEGGVTAAISFEEQPVGILRHLSVATGRPGTNRLVHPVMINEIMRLFGFAGTLQILNGRVWIEEYQPGYYAVNVAELAVEREEGHA